MGRCTRLRASVAGALLPFVTLVGPLPTLVGSVPAMPASGTPMWSNDPHVYVTGKVRCEGEDTPNWVWLEATSGASGAAEVWSERDGGAQFGRHFEDVPEEGMEVSASWACGYDEDEYATSFRLTRPWWGTTTTINLCPWRPCWA